MTNSGKNTGGCNACGHRHTEREPCDYGVRCRGCGQAIRREDGKNICERCENAARRREK